jgi:tripartite-type tricarboxylate transporter receptor subunit TctC
VCRQQLRGRCDLLTQGFFMHRRSSASLALAALLCPTWVVAQTAPAPAGDYPTKPITLVVGYPPGGSTDLTARTVGAELSRRLGQPVIIDNVGGGGGGIGAAKVAQAPADGYTLLLGTNNEMAINKLVNTKLRYDPVADFTPIGRIASQPMVLVASPSSGVKNLNDFIALAKKNPGKFSYGSSGVGTALHLAGEMVKESAGLFIVHIPYRGVAPLTNDLLGGQLEFGVFVLSSGLPHIKSGKVVALGITEPQRSAAAPDIAPLSDHPTLKNVDISSWFGLWGPARMPASLVARLQKALAETLDAPEVRKKLQDNGATLAPAGAALAPFQTSEINKYTRIVKFANIQE